MSREERREKIMSCIKKGKGRGERESSNPFKDKKKKSYSDHRIFTKTIEKIPWQIRTDFEALGIMPRQ